jgi:hypothetical protein
MKCCLHIYFGYIIWAKIGDGITLLELVRGRLEGFS